MNILKTIFAYASALSFFAAYLFATVVVVFAAQAVFWYGIYSVFKGLTL